VRGAIDLVQLIQSDPSKTENYTFEDLLDAAIVALRLKIWPAPTTDKTEEEIICVASYEKKVVEYFNKNKIDFNWQVQTFLMPNGKTYRPDCYLPDNNKWIEIKGYFRKDAREKWEWFTENYPNSELWDEEVLKKMNII